MALEVNSSYRQRDLIASHIIRLGVGLFGDKHRICRRRVIDSARTDSVVRNAEVFHRRETGLSHHIMSEGFKHDRDTGKVSYGEEGCRVGVL